MIVSNKPFTKVYAYTGVATFAIDFPFYGKETVTLGYVSSGADYNTEAVPMTYGVHYTVEGVQGDITESQETFLGGELTILPDGISLLTESTRLVISRSTPIEQLRKYNELDNFPAKSHENALSLLTVIAQELDDELQRTMRISPASEISPSDLIANLVEAEVNASKAAASADASKISAAVSEANAKTSEINAAASAASAAESAHQAGDAAVARVTAEGDTQVARVTATGNEQVATVQNEGTAQVQNIENAGLDILNTASQLAFGAFLPGMVVAFSGSFGGPDNAYPIPKGSTEPDMTWKLHEPSRGKFILGGTGQNQGAVPPDGESDTTKPHTLTAAQMPSHTHGTAAHSHSISIPHVREGHHDNPDKYTGVESHDNTVGGVTYSSNSAYVAINNSGGSQSHSHGQNLPPYYTLAYIEKLNVENPGGGHAVFVTHEEFQAGLLPKADQTNLDELASNTAQALASQSTQIEARVTDEQLTQALAQERDVTNQALAGKQGILTAGANINITAEGVISSTGGGSGGGIEEAPSDGRMYVRKNAAWVAITEITTQGLITASGEVFKTVDNLIFTPTGA